MLLQYSAQKRQGFFFFFSFCYQTLRTVPVLDFPILEESSVQLDSVSSGTNGSFRLQSPGWAADRSGMTSKQNQKPTWCDLSGPALVSLGPMLKVLPLNSYQGAASEWFYCFSSRCVLSPFSRVRLFATLWTVVHQVPLSMGFSRQEYWSGLPCLPPGDLPDPGIKR